MRNSGATYAEKICMGGGSVHRKYLNSFRTIPTMHRRFFNFSSYSSSHSLQSMVSSVQLVSIFSSEPSRTWQAPPVYLSACKDNLKFVESSMICEICDGFFLSEECATASIRRGFPCAAAMWYPRYDAQASQLSFNKYFKP